jgi:hypothetical protein
MQVRILEESVFGASRPLPSIPTEVRLLNRLPTLDLAGGDYSSCPKAAVRHPGLLVTAYRKTARPLLQLVLDLVQAGTSAGFVEIAARRPGSADRSDHLVVHLDDDAPGEQK